MVNYFFYYFGFVIIVGFVILGFLIIKVLWVIVINIVF